MRFHYSDKYDFGLPENDDCWHLDPCRLEPHEHVTLSLKSDDPTKESVPIVRCRRVGINARAVWGQENLGHGIKVVIFDMGVDYEHPNLFPNLKSVLEYAADFDHHLAKPKLVDPVDPKRLSQWKATELTRTYGKGGKIYNRYNGHGTACAGIIAAIDPKSSDDPTIKNSRVIGVAPKAHPVPVRISSNFDIGSLIAAIEYAGEEEIGDVILMPRCLPELDDEPPPKGKPGAEDLRDAIRNLAKKKPVVCASGNNGKGRLIYPASLPEVIAIGACNDLGYRSSYSNYSQYGEGLTAVAPSNDIVDLHRGLIRLDIEEIDVLIREKLEASERRRGNPIPLGRSFGLELLKFSDEQIKQKGLQLSGFQSAHPLLVPRQLGLQEIGMLAIATTDNRADYGYNYEPDASTARRPATSDLVEHRRLPRRWPG